MYSDIFKRDSNELFSNFIHLRIDFQAELAEHQLARLEIYIVCGFHLLQSEHSTSQCNTERRTCCGLGQKHWMNSNIQVDFQSIYFNIDYTDFIIK